MANKFAAPIPLWCKPNKASEAMRHSQLFLRTHGSSRKVTLFHERSAGVGDPAGTSSRHKHSVAYAQKSIAVPLKPDPAAPTIGAYRKEYKAFAQLFSKSAYSYTQTNPTPNIYLKKFPSPSLARSLTRYSVMMLVAAMS